MGELDTSSLLIQRILSSTSVPNGSKSPITIVRNKRKTCFDLTQGTCYIARTEVTFSVHGLQLLES